MTTELVSAIAAGLVSIIVAITALVVAIRTSRKVNGKR